jgi:hypothetical protein
VTYAHRDKCESLSLLPSSPLCADVDADAIILIDERNRTLVLSVGVLGSVRRGQVRQSGPP